jgi:hypothetical protein
MEDLTGIEGFAKVKTVSRREANDGSGHKQL